MSHVVFETRTNLIVARQHSLFQNKVLLLVKFYSFYNFLIVLRNTAEASSNYIETSKYKK